MMPLYEGDVRRCRRCKRRRMDDEPPEVQQYKTCAKCRIIERTKKKSRKPLAEETMRYGMRQFQEQSQNSNFLHDDIFSNDQLMAEMQSAAAAHEAQLLQASINQQKQQQQSQQQQQQQQQSQQPQYNPQQQQYPMYKQPSAPQYQGSTASAGTAVPPDSSSYSYLYANSAGAYPASTAPGSGSRPPSAPSAASPAYASPQLAQQTTQGSVASTVQPSVSGSNNSAAMQYTNPTSSATAAAIAAAAIKRTDQSLGTTQVLSHSSNQYRQYQQKQQGGDRLRMSTATHCELCTESLDGDDSMSAVYRLCRRCYTDPYARPHVYSDFNDFLLAVVRDKDAESVTYISELASYLVEALSNDRAIGSEQQFRKIMLDSFGSIYVDPLIGALAPLAFYRSSHNVTEVNNTAPIISKVSQQYHYTLTPPLRINYTADTDTGATTIDMTFITETNLIIMKKATKFATRVYDATFLKSLDDKMRAKGLTFNEDPAKVYENLDLPLSQDQFFKDYKSLQKQVYEFRTLETSVKQDSVTDQKLVREQNGEERRIKSKDGKEVQEKPSESVSNGGDSAPEKAVKDSPKNGSDSVINPSPQEKVEKEKVGGPNVKDETEAKDGETELPETQTPAQKDTTGEASVKDGDEAQKSEAKELDPAFAS